MAQKGKILEQKEETGAQNLAWEREPGSCRIGPDEVHAPHQIVMSQIPFCWGLKFESDLLPRISQARVPLFHHAPVLLGESDFLKFMRTQGQEGQVSNVFS